MLSILIPIYNYNALPLVKELYNQCLENRIDFEILCQDDASFSKLNIENEKINFLDNCKFVALSKNIAHRENRNALANQAKYNYLLFIDGDSKIIYSDYIKNYIVNIKDFDVVYGGRLHPNSCPAEHKKLRWKYGKFIEDKSSINRMKNIYSSLLFNNTIIKKDVFERIKFDSKMKKYGHDDTQLSYELSLLNTKVYHIDNQIEHGDIDNNTEYLKKVKESIENLKELYLDNKISYSFVNLIYLYSKLEKFKLNYCISLFYKIFKSPIEKKLLGKNPNLLLFNIFKIGYLCSLK